MLCHIRSGVACITESCPPFPQSTERYNLTRAVQLKEKRGRRKRNYRLAKLRRQGSPCSLPGAHWVWSRVLTIYNGVAVTGVETSPPTFPEKGSRSIPCCESTSPYLFWILYLLPNPLMDAAAGFSCLSLILRGCQDEPWEVWGRSIGKGAGHHLPASGIKYP